MYQGKSQNSLILRLSFAVIVVFWVAFFAVFGFSLIERRRYPVTFSYEIVAVADYYNIDRALMFAIIRTESGFDESAVSHRGAKGLMQITDSTGDFIAKRRGIENYDLFDVYTNLDFGGYYVEYLSERFAGITEIMAAYNAGEGTVSKWLKNTEYSEDGVTLDRIPYEETQTYVKKIFQSFKRYKKLYGKLLDK